MTDQDLLRALRSNRVHPTEACARLLDAYGEDLYLRCWSVLRDGDAAHAVLRDTFIVARAHIGRLPRGYCLRDWLHALAEAECARHREPEGRAADRAGGREERPEFLKIRVVSGITGPDLAGYRAHVAARADSFDREGFPVSRGHGGRGRRLLGAALPVVVAVLCALLVVALAGYAVTRDSSQYTRTWIVGPDGGG